VFVSLFNSEVENHVESSTNFEDLEKDLHSIDLLRSIKKLMYTGATSDLSKCHNKTMAHMNLISLYEDKFQDTQDFMHQHMAMHKVCVPANKHTILRGS